MQRLSGVLLMLAGVSLGVYAYLPAPKDGAEKLAEVTRISAAPDRDARSLAPSSDTSRSMPQPAQGALAAGATSAPAVTGSISKAASGTWSTVVTAEQSTAPKLSSSKPGDAETRAELTRDLQKELTRVGCYGGEVNGAWTPSTKRAMSAFMDRVNATLPVNEPDYILLTLVQGHAAEACGTDCPSGQALSGDGRCVPQAVIAQVQNKTQREETRRVAERRKEQQRSHAAQQKVAAAAEAKPSISAAPKKQVLAAAEPEVLPWLRDEAAAITAPKPRPAPPPGMMSIGGPDSQTLSDLDRPITAAKPAAPRQALALADPGEDSDLSPAASDLKAPKPVPAERPLYAPVRKATQQGLPGSKSGIAVRPRPATKAMSRSLVPPPRRVMAVRRPSIPLPPAAIKVARPKASYYAAEAKIRRGQPRPGTPRFNLMQSLGGIY